MWIIKNDTCRLVLRFYFSLGFFFFKETMIQKPKLDY